MTAHFTEYVCWSRANVAETINTEAVHANPAVFLATHRPLAVLRKGWESSEPGEQVDERTVLRDFVDRPPTGGVVLMPIIGESGTGKSHLVRWVGQHLQDNPSRRVIYLRKTETSLSAVIRALLADLDGPRFQDVRDRVSRSIGQYDERRLPHELLDRLALALQFADAANAAETGEHAMMRKALTAERGLPTLLRDYEYRRHLLGPDSVVTRFATELRRGRRGHEGERPTAFGPDDLVADIDKDEIGPVASVIYRQLGHPALRELAARLLTENLDSAVLRLTDLDGGQLAETMIDIRREFHRRGQEIVLLVEDFALIQGIQRDLLDAISEAGVREGRQELATVRTLMAVTGGYFKSLPETVKTRAAASVPYVYELDVPMGAGPVGVGDQHVVDLVGRYLNAARTGEAALVDAYNDAQSAEWVPNACDSCRFRQPCHEAFGESSEGFGLYPYNRTAVLRAVRVTAGRDEMTFNPRRVLSRVVRQVLDNYDTAIRDGRFPPRAFRNDFPRSRLDRFLAPEVEAQMLQADPEDHERRVDLIEFWGDPAAGVANLPVGIHEAFRLPPLPSTTINAPVPEPQPAAQTAYEGPATASALQMKLNAVDAWYGRGEPLPQDLARNLRSWLRQAVTTRVPWHDLGLPYPTDVIRKAALRDGQGHRDRLGNAVTIEHAFGDKAPPPPGPATIVLKKGPVTATMFKAIFRRVEKGDWNFPGGPAQQRLLSRCLDEWAASMVEAVREHVGLHRAQTLAAAVEASLLGARLLNLPGSRAHSREDRLTAVLDPGPDSRGGAVATHKDAETRAPEWTRLASQHLSVRATLVAELRRAVGAAQGGGGEQLVDATVLLPAIDAFVADWRLKADTDNLPEWLHGAYSQLRGHFDAALQAQWTQLRDMTAEYRRLTGDTEPDVLLKELEGALSVLTRVAPGAGGRSPEAWLEDLRQARKYPWAQWQSLLEEVGEPDTEQDTNSGGDDARLRRLRIAAVDRGERFCAVLPFLRQCDRWLDDGLRQAERKRSTQPANPLPELHHVLAEIKTLLDNWREVPNG
ncbi:MAG TPA: protein DpdH [Micromonosporaceae bacterium]|nr:protein DpdH [Micromonosporaceae bacterium]